MPIGKRTFQSAGKISQHLKPGAYSRIDSIKGHGGLVSANNGVIMGQCTGGKPATLLQFNNSQEAMNTLKSGPLAEAVRLAFNPGNDLVPQRLYAMRVNDATAATGNLVDGDSDNMVKFTSRDWGLHTNQIRFKQETGTNYGKKITVMYKDNPDEVFDDIRRQSLTITHASATVSITNNSGTHELTLSVGPITVDLDSYSTIGDLAAYINAQSGYSATAIAGEEDASSLELDTVTTQSCVGGYTAESTMEAIIDTVDDGSAWVKAEAANGANDRVIPDNITETYLTGGAEGTYDGTTWDTALTALEAEDVQFIATPDSDSSYHSKIKTHCESMSAVTGRKERQFCVGGTWGDSVSTATAAAITLNSKWGLYVYNGFKQRNINNVLTNFAPAYAACLLLGMKVALATNAPLTFKELNVIELENKVSDSNLETLIENGVCPLAYNPSGLPHVVRQVNTYQTDDLKWNEFSMVTIMGFVSRDLRTYLEGLFVGKAGTTITNGVLKGAVETKLAQYTDDGLFIEGEEGAWWNVQITFSGDTVYVDYDAYITPPVNFIFVTNHFHELVDAA